jgi:hypothetical protein
MDLNVSLLSPQSTPIHLPLPAMVEIEGKVIIINNLFNDILTYCTINIIYFTNNIFTLKELCMSYKCKGIERIVLSRHSTEFNSIILAFLVFI